MIKDMVGLEAEFFVVKDGELVYPANYGFSTDDLVILGEFRAAPGKTRAESLGNFYKEYYTVQERARKNGVEIFLGDGFWKVSAKFYAELMRKIATKNVAQAQNIYPDTDLLSLSDAVVENGVIQHHFLSTGLHIHFSSQEENETVWKEKKERFSPVNLPINFGGSSLGSISVYQKEGTEEVERKIKSAASRITRPVLRYFVEQLDTEVLPSYNPGVPLKYRRPGFYEIKPYGFEYRSLPFSEKVLAEIFAVVDFSFTLLEKL